MVDPVQSALRADMHRLFLDAPPPGLFASLRWHRVASVSQWTAVGGLGVLAASLFLPAPVWIESSWPWAVGSAGFSIALVSAAVYVVGRISARTRGDAARRHILEEYGIALHAGGEFRLVETRVLDPRLTETASVLHSMPIMLRRTGTGA